MKLTDLLKPYKEMDREQEDINRRHSYAAAMLIDNRIAQRVLIAFSFLPVGKWKRPSGNPPKDPRLMWDWIWGGAQFSIIDLAQRAGVSEDTAEETLSVLKGARLIFPDGETSLWARVVLDAEITKMSQTKGRR